MRLTTNTPESGIMAKKDRKKFRDTKVGAWLKEKAPAVLDTVGDLLPEQGVLGVVKNLLDRDEVDPAVRAEYESMWLEFYRDLDEGTTARWTSDMASDSWLSKNVRPLALSACLPVFFGLSILDSMAIDFSVAETYVDAYRQLLTLIVTAYFGARSLDKMGITIGK